MDGLGVVLGVVMVAAIVIGVLLMQLAQDFLARQKSAITQHAKGGLEDMFIFVDPTRLFYFQMGALVLVPLVLWLMFENIVVVVGAAVAITLAPKFVVNTAVLEAASFKEKLARFGRGQD